jgi:hypothetical protein
MRWWATGAIHFAIDPPTAADFSSSFWLFRLIEYSSPFTFFTFFFKWSILFYLQLANVTAAIFFCPVASQLKNGEKKEKGKKVLRECGTHVTFSVMNRILRHSPSSSLPQRTGGSTYPTLKEKGSKLNFGRLRYRFLFPTLVSELTKI